MTKRTFERDKLRFVIQIFRILKYFAVTTILLFSFQNCDSAHELATNVASTSGTGPQVGLSPEEFQALQSQALTILQNRCASCHTGTVSGENPPMDAGELRAARFVIPGQPQNSPLYLLIIDGVMPENGPNLTIAAPGEVNTLRDWIQYMR